MKRVNQTESATFSILTFLNFFRNWNFLYFSATSALFVPSGGRKRSPRTFNQRSYISDPYRSARHYCNVCGIFSSYEYFYLNNVESLLGYVICFLTYHLWYTDFITSDPHPKLFRELFFTRFWHTLSITLGPNDARYNFLWSELKMIRNMLMSNLEENKTCKYSIRSFIKQTRLF
jgi:hypothetical protein